MKTLKTTIIIVLLLNVCNLFAQGVTINVSQDTRLLLLGDNHGNDALTLNYQISSEWRTLENNKGAYLVIRPEFEYANLKNAIYRRYSANVGVTFTQMFNSDFLSKFNYTATIGYGVIDYDMARSSFGANLQLSYPITDKLEVFLDYQVVDRKDLLRWEAPQAFGTVFRGSGLFGIKYKIFTPRR